MRNVIRTSDARHTGGIGLYGHRGQLPDERFGRGLVFFTVRRPGPDRPDERTVKHGRAPAPPDTSLRLPRSRVGGWKGLSPHIKSARLRQSAGGLRVLPWGEAGGAKPRYSGGFFARTKVL